MTGEDTWKQQALHHCNRADRLQRELDELQEKNQRQAEMIESLRRTNDDLRIDVTALTVWRQKVARVLRSSLEQIQELVEDG